APAAFVALPFVRLLFVRLFCGLVMMPPLFVVVFEAFLLVARPFALRMRMGVLMLVRLLFLLAAWRLAQLLGVPELLLSLLVLVLVLLFLLLAVPWRMAVLFLLLLLRGRRWRLLSRHSKLRSRVLPRPRLCGAIQSSSSEGVSKWQERRQN